MRFICENCNREISTLLKKKVMCKVCKKQMEEVKEEKIIYKPKEKKEFEHSYKSPIYKNERAGWQKFKINDKIAWGKRVN